MRHDGERPRTNSFVRAARVPEHWDQVLAEMRTNASTCLTVDEIRAEATHIIVIAPSTEVVHASLGELLGSLPDRGFLDILPLEFLTPTAMTDIPAGTWIFLPHRQDGWTDLEVSSARLRAELIAENTARSAGEKFTLIEYGVNLWLWAEPPHGGGDPVCHAGELVAWESAWALEGPSPAVSNVPLTRPPIYFGLPSALRRKRAERPRP